MPEVHSSPCFLTPRRLNPNAPLFVFLPGLDGTGELLRVQTAGLEVEFDVRCLAIPPESRTSLEELAAEVVDLVKHELAIGKKRPVYLCGESFGGCLALRVALQAPHLFDRIVLVNPASSLHARPWISLGAELTRWTPNPLYRVSCLGFLALLANLERVSLHDRAALFDIVRSVPQQATIWRLSLLSKFTVTQAELKRLTQPILLIAAQRDQLLPSVAEAQRLARGLANAKVAVLPNSGHACLLEADVNLYEMMREHHFLSEPSEALLASA